MSRRGRLLTSAAPIRAPAAERARHDAVLALLTAASPVADLAAYLYRAPLAVDVDGLAAALHSLDAW